MRKIKYGTLVAAALISAQSFAFTVQIANNTNDVCKLEHYDLKHGLLYTFPPLRVAPGDYEMFTLMSSSFRGPEIELFFKCGAKKINITSQENKWILKAGQIHATLEYTDPGITANYYIKQGSSLWGQAGNLTWNIESQ